MFSSAVQVIMERYNVAQCVEVIKIYYKNSCSIVITFRALRFVVNRICKSVSLQDPANTKTEAC